MHKLLGVQGTELVRHAERADLTSALSGQRPGFWVSSISTTKFIGPFGGANDTRFSHSTELRLCSTVMLKIDRRREMEMETSDTDQLCRIVVTICS